MPDFNLLTLMADIEERRQALKEDIRRIERAKWVMVAACLLSLGLVVLSVML